jgi:heptosyltransferase II
MNAPVEIAHAVPWKKRNAPGKILAIRLQAFGDTVIALPWLGSLREQFPTAQIDFLVLEANADLPRGIILFDHVIGLKGSTARKQFVQANMLLPALILQRYDVVIDLQRNRISRWIRFWIFPKAWSEIERFSRSLAGDKFRKGIEASGFKNIALYTNLRPKEDDGIHHLERAGWNRKNKLVVLNPAGAFVSRNWPVESYITFAKLWLKVNPDTHFVFLGIERLVEKAVIIAAALPHDRVINLTNQLTPSASFSVLSHAHLVLTEDSALMHMAWIQRLPTLALFGSSPSYWSAPMGAWSACLSSSDLPCGDCLSPSCRFGDVHCLTRYSPELILERAQIVLKSSAGK